VSHSGPLRDTIRHGYAAQVSDPEAARWFAGALPRNEGEAAFLASLRASAAAWRVAGVTPDSTRSLSVINPLYVECRVPDLPPGSSLDSVLQVGYLWDPVDPTLLGEWDSENYLLDGASGTDILNVVGIAASPVLFGEWTADWMWRQLQRPVERVEFLGRRGEELGTEWRLADNLRSLGTTGHWWQRRRAADRRVVRVRG
jgi:hypothetical protein